jgi:transcriptional regulator with XRE-family HTH domain
MDNNNQTDTTRAFGQYIKARRESLGKSMRSIADKIGIVHVYYRDIELGNRAAPEKHLEQMMKALEISGDDVAVFYDLAGKSRKDSFPDINPYIAKKPIARTALRKARDFDISDEQWKEFIDKINKDGNRKI